MQHEPRPIACTLSAGDFKSRLAWIANLNRAALRAHRREDLRLVLTYDRGAAGRVRAMVAREQTCCPFLKFDVTEDCDGIRVTADAPEEAREAIDALFEQFQATTVGTDGDCTCDSEPSPDGLVPNRAGAMR